MLGFCLYQLHRALKDCLKQLLAGEEFVACGVIFLHDAEQISILDIAPEFHAFVVIIVPLPQYYGPLELFVCLKRSHLGFVKPKGSGYVLANGLRGFELQEDLISSEAIYSCTHELCIYCARPVHLDKAAFGILCL